MAGVRRRYKGRKKKKKRERQKRTTIDSEFLFVIVSILFFFLVLYYIYIYYTRAYVHIYVYTIYHGKMHCEKKKITRLESRRQNINIDFFFFFDLFLDQCHLIRDRYYRLRPVFLELGNSYVLFYIYIYVSRYIEAIEQRCTETFDEDRDTWPSIEYITIYHAFFTIHIYTHKHIYYIYTYTYMHTRGFSFYRERLAFRLRRDKSPSGEKKGLLY